jgi:hypothetical protein
MIYTGNRVSEETPQMCFSGCMRVYISCTSLGLAKHVQMTALGYEHTNFFINKQAEPTVQSCTVSFASSGHLSQKQYC